MAKVRINGDTSGYIELASPGTAGSNTLILPSSNGSANQLLKNSGTAGTLDWSTLTEDSSGNLNIDSGTLYVDASNNRVGIGTTSPLSTLHVEGTSRFVAANSALFNGTTGTYSTWLYNGTAVGDIGTGNQIFSGGSNTDFGVTSRSSTSLVFGTNTVERARIDSSGRLLVGTSTSRGDNFNLTGQDMRLQVEGTDYLQSGASFTSNTNTAAEGPHIVINRSRGTTVGSNTVVQNGDRLGLIAFQGNDGAGFVGGAFIECLVDGTPGANDMPSRLVFSTTADGASSPTERIRIDANGQCSFQNGSIFIGTSAIASGAGTNALKWNSSTRIVTYDTSSRLIKENIEDCPYGIDAIKLLQPRKYFRTDDQRDEIGFVADELVNVLPEFVPIGPKSVITKNEDDSEGIPLGVNYDRLTAVLTKALQEAIAKIEVLEQRLADAGIA